MAELIAIVALVGWLYIAWVLWGRIARHLGTTRWRLIGWLTLLDRVFRR